MTYLIDAWLDRPHPYLRILHRETGEVCAVLEEEALNELQRPGRPGRQWPEFKRTRCA